MRPPPATGPEHRQTLRASRPAERMLRVPSTVPASLTPTASTCAHVKPRTPAPSSTSSTRSNPRLHRPPQPAAQNHEAAHSWPRPAVTAWSCCSNSRYTPGSARTNSSACAGKTSTSPVAPPTSDAPSNVPTLPGLPPSRPRRRTPNDASPYRRHALHSLGQHRNRQRHTGVAATVYTHVPLRLQRDVIDLLGNALRNPAEIIGKPDDSDEPPLCATPFR